MGRCERCASDTMVLDASLGALCCTSCGIVGESNYLSSEYQVGMMAERGGFNVLDDGGGALQCTGPRGSRFNSNRDWKGKKRSVAVQRIREVTNSLGFDENRFIDVQDLVKRATADEWGTGRWLGVLAGACSYIVARNAHLPLTLPEVAYAVDCDVFELGRMLSRVVRLLNLQLEQTDPLALLDRYMSSSGAFSDKAVRKQTVAHCRVLLEFLKQCCFTCGRHASPVAAAVLFVAAQANGLDAALQDISSGLNAPLSTTMKRYKELQEALVTTIQEIPWCKNVTAADLHHHLLFVLDYISLSSKLSKRKRPNDHQEVEPDGKKRNAEQPQEAGAAILPKAFVVSKAARERRLLKLKLACQRIARTKKALGNATADSTSVSVLDREDIIIEYLLLQGVESEQIEQGYYDSLVAALQRDVDDMVLSDEEISKCLRKDENLVQLLRQLKFAPESQPAAPVVAEQSSSPLDDV